MEQSQLIQAIKKISSSADENKHQKLQDIINNKYFNNLIRSSAIIELGKLKNKNCVTYLVQKLKNENEALKEEIIWALGNIGDKNAYVDLKLIMDDETQQLDLRIAAALALFELGYREETEEILLKLRSQLKNKRKINKDIFISDSSKIIESIKKLSTSNDIEKIIKLQNIIKNKYINNHIRAFALQALGANKSVESIDFLTNLLNDSEERLKEVIIGVIAAIGDKSGYQALYKILADNSAPRELRIAAALALYQLGFEEETAPILKQLKSQISQSREKQKTKKTTAHSKTTRTSKDFIEIVKHIASNPNDNQKAAKLETIIKNKFLNNYIRSQAIIELGKLKNNNSSNFFLERLNDINEPLKEQIIWALGASGSVKAYKDLQEILLDNSKKLELRIAAALALYELGFKAETESVLLQLRERLKNREKFLASDFNTAFHSRVITMIKKLAKSNDMQKAIKLQNIISNKHFNDNIRTQAIIELGNLKSYSSLKFLMDKLNDKNEHLKEQIIWALGIIGGGAVTSTLKNILYESTASTELRIAAALALYNTGAKKDAEPVLKQLREKYQPKKKHLEESKVIDETNLIPSIDYSDKIVFIMLGKITDDHIDRLKSTLQFMFEKHSTKHLYINLSDITDVRLQQLKKFYEFLLNNKELKNKISFISSNEKISNIINDSGFFKDINIIKELKEND